VRSGPTWVTYTVYVGPIYCSGGAIYCSVGPKWAHVLFGWTRVYCSSGAPVEPVYYSFGTYILFSWDPRIKYISLFSIYKNNNTTLYTTFTCASPTTFWILLSLCKLAKYNRIIHSLLILSFFLPKLIINVNQSINCTY